MFSTRVPSSLAPNRLARALQQLRASGGTIIDLTESNPTRAGFDYPVDLLEPLGGRRALVYEPHALGLAPAREAVARDFIRRGVAISPGRIVLTTSTSEAYSMLFKLLCDTGDEVLVPQPSYPLFDHLARLDAVRPVPYRLEYDGAWSVNLDELARAVSARTRAVLAVNPNNPTGSFLARDEIDKIAAICGSRSLALVGDEVFADYRLDPVNSHDAGSVSETPSVLVQQEALTFSLGGLSKSIGLPQAKLAWLGVGGPGELAESALERLEFICDAYLSVSTPVQCALDVLLARGVAVRSQISLRVRENLRRLMNLVARQPACRLMRPEGGWYAVLQVPATRTEETMVLELLERDSVLVHPGYFFDFPREAFLVISLLVRPDDLFEGVSRILARVEA